jgi:class 3 adenylate cyclase
VATVLFADIAGFTALTEAHGEEEAATLVADFRAVPGLDRAIIAGADLH